MADQVFNVTCGFFDSINKDRVYSADQMTMPYKRLVADGVFATKEGTPSTDLQVIAGTGRAVVVLAGNAMVGNKWFESPSSIAITIPENTAVSTRIDSVIIQVDKRMSGRNGSVVYRTGTASGNPVPPDLSTDDSVVEYRVANIEVAAGATSITQSNITDLRGTSECPWVAGLITQVDTSTLWTQYSSAFAALYNQYTAEYEEYTEQQKAAWDAFIQTLTDQLDVSTNVVMLTNVVTTEGTTGSVSIGIPLYDQTTDILQVYINGLLATKDVDYTENGTRIDLATQLEAGQTVYFVCLKSVISASIESAVSMIQRLDRKVDSFMSDSGWLTLPIESGTAGAIAPKIRCIGNRCYMTGLVSGASVSQNIVTVPVSMRPAENHVFVSAAYSNGAVSGTATISISAATGAVQIISTSGTLTGDIVLSAEYLANSGNTVWSVYSYKGSINAYYELPTDAQVGDVYMVLSDAPSAGISAGDSVLWNGSAWEILEATIPSFEIDGIIDSIS